MNDRQTTALFLAVFVAFVLWLANAQSSKTPGRSRLSEVLDVLRDTPGGGAVAALSSSLQSGLPRIPVPVLGTGRVDGAGFRQGTAQDLIRENPGWDAATRDMVLRKFGAAPVSPGASSYDLGTLGLGGLTL